jgi:hypothetical protein
MGGESVLLTVRAARNIADRNARGVSEIQNYVAMIEVEIGRLAALGVYELELLGFFHVRVTETMHAIKFPTVNQLQHIRAYLTRGGFGWENTDKNVLVHWY